MTRPIQRAPRAIAFGLVVAGATLLTAVAPTTALAAHRRIYPGNICDVWFNDQANAANLIRSQFGQVSNASTTTPLHVVCPVMRDNTSNTDGLNLGRIWLADQNPNENFSCTLRATDSWGDGSDVDFETIASSGTGSNFFTFWNVDHSLALDEALGGTYSLICSIPPKFSGNLSVLGSYYIEEP